MAIQYSTTIRNAMNDAWATAVAGSCLIRIYSGVVPSNCAAALSGNTLLAELTGNATLAPASSSGVLTLNAITADASANATGTATFYRIYNSSGTVCHEQGTVTATGGGGDMTLLTTSIVATMGVSITSWTKTAPGA